MAPHMVGLGGVNWSSTWGSVLGCWGHNGDLHLLCFFLRSRRKKKHHDKKYTYPQIHRINRCWHHSSFFRLPTVCGSPTSPSLMARSLFLKFEEQNILKKVERRFACLSGFGLTTTSTLATTTPRPILGDHQVKPKYSGYSLLSR